MERERAVDCSGVLGPAPVKQLLHIFLHYTGIDQLEKIKMVA